MPGVVTWQQVFCAEINATQSFHCQVIQRIFGRYLPTRFLMFGLFSLARKNTFTGHSVNLTVVSKTSKRNLPNGRNWLLILLLLLVVTIWIVMTEKELPPGLITTPDGDISLSPERQAIFR